MMYVFTIVILALNISVSLHPFPHLMPWKRLLTYYIYNDPNTHTAIPNGSQVWIWGYRLKSRSPPLQKGFERLNRGNGKRKTGKNRCILAVFFAKCLPIAEKGGETSRKKI